jgi:hypothetical protein
VVLDVVQAQALACDETLLAHSLLRQTASVSQRGIWGFVRGKIIVKQGYAYRENDV